MGEFPEAGASPAMDAAAVCALLSATSELAELAAGADTSAVTGGDAWDPARESGICEGIEPHSIGDSDGSDSSPVSGECTALCDESKLSFGVSDSFSQSQQLKRRQSSSFILSSEMIQVRALIPTVGYTK